MAYWEFLLQKEGDRDWLPLETAHVEISEGRYRVIAHTSYRETPVEVRFSQLLTTAMPPKRRTLKRSGHTNQDGLMVVIPFTHLPPGSWTITCRGADTDEYPEEGTWEYGVQLQVLAIESGLDYWDADLEEDSTPYADEGASPPTTVSPPAPEPFDPSAIFPTETTTSSVSSLASDLVASAGSPALLDADPIADLPLRLQLQHQAIVAQQQANITLRGQITSFSQLEGLPTDSTLWVQLRDPETSAVLYRAAQRLSMPELPRRFDVTLTLPPTPETTLLVGELSLWSAMTPPQVLAIQGFTVTLNLDALLEAVANRGEQSAAIGFEETPPSAEPLAGQSSSPQTGATDLLETALSPRKIPFRRIYLPSAGLTLPPVIYSPIDSRSSGEPTLPLTAKRRSRPTAPADALRSPTLPSIGKEHRAPDSHEDAATTTPRSTVDLPSFGRSPTPPESDAPDTAADPAPAPAAETTEALTFQPDFQGRFWSRLSALAQEAQKAAADLKAQMEAAGVQSRPAPSDPAADASDRPSPDLPQFVDTKTALNHEVVIYDSEEDTTDLVSAPTPASESAPAATTTAAAPPEDIPVPQLQLPTGDLIAGAPLPITVHLPGYPRRLTVKVWVTDIQSRSLVDRPRWLMNWTPTDTGDQMAHLQLQVPLGSVEAQFEAIAIDLSTQQESYKTTIIKTIVPPNLSAPDAGLE